MWETPTPVIWFQNKENFVQLLPEPQIFLRAQSEYPEQKQFIKVRFGITRIGLIRNRTSSATETGKFIFEQSHQSSSDQFVHNDNHCYNCPAVAT